MSDKPQYWPSETVEDYDERYLAWRDELGHCDFGGCPRTAISVVVGESGDLHLCADHENRSLASEGVCRFCDVVLDGQLHMRFCPLFKGTQ